MDVTKIREALCTTLLYYIQSWTRVVLKFVSNFTNKLVKQLLSMTVDLTENLNLEIGSFQKSTHCANNDSKALDSISHSLADSRLQQGATKEFSAAFDRVTR